MNLKNKKIELSVVALGISVICFIFSLTEKEDYYASEYDGNYKTITTRTRGKIGASVRKYEKIKITKLRIDDESQYHISYIKNGMIYNDHDICGGVISVRDGNGDSWKRIDGGWPMKYDIQYPLDKIIYFED